MRAHPPKLTIGDIIPPELTLITLKPRSAEVAQEFPVRPAYHLDGITRALADLTREYLHPQPATPLAPTLRSTLEANQKFLNRVSENPDMKALTSKLSGEVDRLTARMTLATAMDRFLINHPQPFMAQEKALDPAFDVLFVDSDDRIVLNLLYRFLDTIEEFELRLDQPHVFR